VWNQTAVASLVALSWSCPNVFAQQLAFTSRAHLQSPVIVESIESSKDYGFESVMVRNDAPDTVIAVRLQVTLHSAAGDEIADEMRIPVQLPARETKRISVGMAQIKGLKDRLRSYRQEDGLAILTIEALEFRDGTEWKRPPIETTDAPTSPASIPKK
jgi:hypothetical protein